MANMRSVLKPEGSVMAGIAVVGGVYSIYNLDVGSVAQASATDANHTALESARKKAAYTAFGLVSALVLITRDGNVGVLGYLSIIAFDLHYRTAIMADPVTGRMIYPASTAYQPAGDPIPDLAAPDGNVYPMSGAAS